MPSPEVFTPAQVATLIGGLDASTIRRWCAWHSAHLSAGANPAPPGQRLLTAQDVEMLREVQRLRRAGLTTPAINTQLAGRVFAAVETAPTAQDGPGEAIAPAREEISTALLESLTAAIVRSQNERERLHGFVLGVSVGVVVAAVFFLIIVLLAWVYGSV